MYEPETHSEEEETELYRAIFKSIYQNGNWYQTASGVLLMLRNLCSRFKKAHDMKSPVLWVDGIGYMFVMVGNGLFQIFGILQI